MSSVAREQIVRIILVHTNQKLTNDLTLSDCLNRSPATPVLSGLDQLGGWKLAPVETRKLLSETSIVAARHRVETATSASEHCQQSALHASTV